MKKIAALPIILCFFLFAGMFPPAPTAEARGGSSGSALGFPGQPPERPQFIIPPDYTETGFLTALPLGGIPYVSLIAFIDLMTPAIVTNYGDSMEIDAPSLHITAAAGDDFITANGVPLQAPGPLRMIGGELYVPLSAIAEAFGASVTWDRNTNAVTLPDIFSPIRPDLPDNPYLDDTPDYLHNDEDLHWLARIIFLEARSEGMTGMIAVGNVIMNRVYSPLFPDTVREVILDNRSGVQFPPAHTDAINREPSAAAIEAAMRVLVGENVAGASLYFNPKGSNSWASRNRPYIMTIGNHDFYG